LSKLDELAGKYDRSRMLKLIMSMPEDWERAVSEYEGVEYPDRGAYVEPNNIVVLGMGGSAIGGDFVSNYLYDKLNVPFVVSRSFSPPPFVSKETLVIAVSYSGNTEETLRSLLHSIERGASVVLVTSDGLMEKLAERKSLPVYRLPKGRPPRAAIPYMVAVILWVLDRAGVYEFPREEAGKVALTLRNVREELRREEERVLSIVEGIERRIPLIYSYKPYSAAGFRFKTQLNENAKIHAFYAELPEANHNEIVGWEGYVGDRYVVFFIRGREEPDYLRHRVEYWGMLLKSRGVPSHEIRGEGKSRLPEMMSLVFKVDLLSCALALLKGVDPTPIATISGLKKYVEDRVHFKEFFEEKIGEIT